MVKLAQLSGISVGLVGMTNGDSAAGKQSSDTLTKNL
jgi:hypothetical protein